MAALRPEERARLAAVREFELARLVGDGDIAEGLLRLRIAERRAYRRVPPLPPARAQQQEQESAAQQDSSGSSRRRGRRGGASRRRTTDSNATVEPDAQRQDDVTGSAMMAPQEKTPQQQPQQQPQQPPGLQKAALVPRSGEAPPAPQAPAQAAAGLMEIDARDKRLLSPSKPAPATADSPPTSQQPAPKRQLLPPSSRPPSAPPSPPSTSPLSPRTPPNKPSRAKPPTATSFLPRPLAIGKPKPPPTTPTKPPSSSSPPQTEVQSKTASATPTTPTRVRPRRLELGDPPPGSYAPVPPLIPPGDAKQPGDPCPPPTGSSAPVPPPADAKHPGGKQSATRAKKKADPNEILTRYECVDCFGFSWSKSPCPHSKMHTHPRKCFYEWCFVWECQDCCTSHVQHCETCRREHSNTPAPQQQCDSVSDSDCSCDLSFLDD